MKNMKLLLGREVLTIKCWCFLCLSVSSVLCTTMSTIARTKDKESAAHSNDRLESATSKLNTGNSNSNNPKLRKIFQQVAIDHKKVINPPNNVRRLQNETWWNEFCEDVPNWNDADGETYDCNWYAETANACSDFGDTLMNFNHTANTACCVCKFSECWKPKTPCSSETTCKQCCDGFEFWKSLNGTACGKEPCFLSGETCPNKFMPDQLYSNDICKEGGNYTMCDPAKFEPCSEDFMLCYYRLPRNDTFYDSEKIHPVFYIDYEVARCVPKWNYEKKRWWDCDKCTGHNGIDTSSWCKDTGHCMISDNSKCRCTDTVKDPKKAAQRRTYCEKNGLVFNKEPRSNLLNGAKCIESSECKSGCCHLSDSGRKKCRKYKERRACI